MHLFFNKSFIENLFKVQISSRIYFAASTQDFVFEGCKNQPDGRERQIVTTFS